MRTSKYSADPNAIRSLHNQGANNRQISEALGGASLVDL